MKLALSACSPSSPGGRATRWTHSPILLTFCSSLILLSGCASPGTPRAPSLRLPEPVRNLSAERFGDHVNLHWTVPAESTDHEPLEGRKHSAGPLHAEICRAATAAGHCDVTFTLPVAAGQPATASDALSAPLTSGPFRPLFYRVRILNGSGHAAEGSREVMSAAGGAPARITGLAASTTARGLQLTWRRESVLPGERLLLRVEPTAGSGRLGGAGPKTRNLSVALGAPTGKDLGSGDTGSNSPRVSAGPAVDPGGTVDPALGVGEQARYTVFRSVETTMAGQLVVVHGDTATLTASRERDTFPPAVPTGLAALAVQLDGTPPEIDLSWEPDTEPDLLGYYIYRAPAVGGDWLRLNAKPRPGISYRDLQVTAGARFRYSVTAVDRSGNESARCTAAEEGLRP